LAVAIFLIINFLFYKTLNVYYKKEFGKKMWKLGGREFISGKLQYLLVQQVRF